MSIPGDPTMPAGDATMPAGGPGGPPGADPTMPVTRQVPGGYGGPGGPPGGGYSGGNGDDDNDRRRLWFIAGGVLLGGILVGVLIALLAGGGGGGSASGTTTSSSSSTSTSSTSTSTSTSSTTTQPQGVQILQFTSSQSPTVQCPNVAHTGTVHLTFTYATQNAHLVIIGIGNPGEYAHSNNSTGQFNNVPFECSNTSVQYWLTIYQNSDGSGAMKQTSKTLSSVYPAGPPPPTT